MPVYIVTAPDGKKYKVTVPEGGTGDDAIAYLHGTLSAKKTAPGAGYSDAATSRINIISTSVETGFVMFWTTLLAFLIFRVTAYKYWKKIRVTPVDNGVWCGGIAAALAPFGVMNKIAQRVSINEYAISLIVVAMLYFAVAFVVGFVWRTLKAAPNEG